MPASEEQAAFEQLARRIDPHGTLLRTRNLTGGVSAQVTVLEIAHPGHHTTKLVVRQHGERDRAGNPNIARDEFRLLEVAQSHELAAPKPVYLDDSCELFPTPLLVVEFVEGETISAPEDLQDFLTQMADQLARVHAVKYSPELVFLSRLEKGFSERPATLDDSMNEGRIRDALESAWPLDQINASVLLHGDYWPGNLLWKDGRIAAVIDWEDARIGDPLADLGNTRLELLWALGFDAMQQFTDQYASLAGIDLTNLPYWDLAAAVRPCSRLSEWGLAATTETRMKEQHALFVDQAIDRMNRANLVRSS